MIALVPPLCHGVDNDTDASIVEVCCAEFAGAAQHGTDNEGWGAAVSSSWPERPLAWHAGTDLPPLRFCPFCGEPLPPEIEEIPQ